MSEHGPTERFTTRVAEYVRWRPGYPDAALDVLAERCGVGPGSFVADVGSGTGILTAPLLARGARVAAVEPNSAMRAAAAERLGSDARFSDVAGTAEHTGLDGASVDVVTAAQAFHWFDPPAARREFVRILRDRGAGGREGGWVALLWNERSTDASEFLAQYERLLRELAPEYAVVDHRNRASDEAIRSFYAPARVEHHVARHEQRFGWDGLRGRVLSSSYVPAPGEPGHDVLLTRLRHLYDQHTDTAGDIVWIYETSVWIGRICTAARDAGRVYHP